MTEISNHAGANAWYDVVYVRDRRERKYHDWAFVLSCPPSYRPLSVPPFPLSSSSPSTVACAEEDHFAGARTTFVEFQIDDGMFPPEMYVTHCPFPGSLSPNWTVPVGTFSKLPVVVHIQPFQHTRRSHAVNKFLMPQFHFIFVHSIFVAILSCSSSSYHVFHCIASSLLLRPLRKST